MKKLDVARLAEQVGAEMTCETDRPSRGCMYYLKVKSGEYQFTHTAYSAREAYAFLSGLFVARNARAPMLDNEWAPNPTLQIVP